MCEIKKRSNKWEISLVTNGFSYHWVKWNEVSFKVFYKNCNFCSFLWFLSSKENIYTKTYQVEKNKINYICSYHVFISSFIFSSSRRGHKRFHSKVTFTSYISSYKLLFYSQKSFFISFLAKHIKKKSRKKFCFISPTYHYMNINNNFSKGSFWTFPTFISHFIFVFFLYVHDMFHQFVEIFASFDFIWIVYSIHHTFTFSLNGL